MAGTAVVVFIALQFFEAGYGYLFDRRYGPPVPNKVGWVLMESPVFVAMCVLWALSDRQWDTVPLVLFAIFQLHYFQRSFIFPMLMRGNSKMPLGIVAMGFIFNTLNALMQGGWIFFLAPQDYYADWFSKPFIYIGIAVFFAGMFGRLTILSATCVSRGTPNTIFLRVVCSVTFHQQITLASWSSGRALPSLRGRGQAWCSFCGHLPTLHPALRRCINAMRRSLARSLPRLDVSA